MGLFGFGKKKNTQEQKINDTFASFGANTNEIKQPGKESRVDAARAAEAARIAAQKKEQILEKMAATAADCVIHISSAVLNHAQPIPGCDSGTG